MADKVRCSQGHENQAGANFCRFCGEKIPGGQMKCPSCGEMNDSSANFCGKCGKSIRETTPADIKHMIWRRNVDDFATRIDVEDLEGKFGKGIVIEQGTKALLFINGALAEVLQPGIYTLEGVTSWLKKIVSPRTATALLVDSADVEIQLNLTGIYTKDPLNIDITCKVSVQIENPTFFFNNIMKGRRSYLVSELRNSLYDEMMNAFNEAVGKKSVVDLNWDLSLKRQFEVSVENHLRTTFQRNGLNFIQLRTIDYRFKGYDKTRGIFEEVFLQVSEEEAKLQGRKRLFDVFDKNLIQGIFEETKKAEYFEKRNEVWDRLRNLANSDKMSEIKNADAFEAFILEIDKGKLLRTDEIESLANSFEQNKRRRGFLLRKIDLEQEIEFENLRLVGKEEIELKRFEVEAKRRRMEFEEDIKSYLGKAKAEAAVKDLEREADQKDLDMGLAAMERMKKMKLQQTREEMEIESERLDRLSKVGIQALISASGEEQAKILADLQKTEILKGLPAEQILALGAKESPAVAKAFEEKFKGLSVEKQEQLYKEMLADRDKSMKMMQEMFTKSLETQRDVSVTAARGPMPNVIYPPPGQPGFFTAALTPGGTDLIICQKCHTKVPTGQKYCSNCGSEMFK